MLAAFQTILSALAGLSPIVSVNPDERGVRVRWGRIIGELGPGIYFKWPIIEHCPVRSVVDAVAELNTQSLTTADAKAVSISGRLRYRIADVTKAHFAVYDIDDTLVEECEAQVATAVMDRSFAALLQREEVEAEILDFIEESVGAWGVEPIEFSITNLTTCRVVRLLQE